MTDTQSIKDRIDIVQLISEYIPLKKSGVNWKAPCPFHHEKTPSFMVHPEKQIWHCFGCGKGSDIFGFIQEIEGMDFPETLKFLADKAGIKLENNFQNEAQKSQKNRILEINAKAAYFFHRFLLDIPGAQTARDYLSRRKLDGETIEKWQIGFVPDQWELLTKYLLKKGFSIDDLVAAGLTIKRDGADAKTGHGYYDRFRGRVMFPLWDAHGNVVGFTGRVLVETENSGGKYVNTPQTPVYDKSRVFYGIDKAKSEIKKKDLAVIVEGQMDVISCHQAGMMNVIAASGTALTPEQVRLLKRYTSNIAMAFDADNAGQIAARRGIDIAMQEGMNIKVIQIPDGAGKDADECIKKDKAVWLEAVEKAVSVMDWHFKKILVGVNVSIPREKQKAFDELLREIVKITYPVERDGWLKKLADRLDIDQTVVKESIKGLSLKASKTSVNSEKVILLQPPKVTVIHDRYFMLLSDFWSILLKFPNLYDYYAADLNSQYFIGSDTEALYESVEKQYNTIHKLDVAELREKFHKDNKENYLDILLLQAEKDFCDLNEAGARAEIQLLIAEIKKSWNKRKKDLLATELRKAQSENDVGRQDEILKEIMLLT